MSVRRAVAVLAGALAWAGAGCSRPREPAPPSGDPVGSAASAVAGSDAAEASQEEKLAAIQKAMNELDKAAQQCWAVAATDRFDIAGEITLQIDIAPERSKPTVVHDTARNTALSTCLVQLMAGYHWAPPLYGQAIQLPFQFRAPDGQNTIDRALVAWHGQGQGQGRVSVAVLLDENNSGSDAASMFEIAVAAGGTTGLRRADRAELWYFLGPAEVRSPAGGSHAVAAGDMMYAPRGAAREVAAPGGDVHAMIVMVPGGREGAARGGALPTPEVGDVGGVGGVGGVRGTGAPAPRILPAAAAKTRGPATIYTDAAAIPDRSLAAQVLAMPAGTRVAEHVHAGQAEVLYVLAGGGTLTVNGVELPVTPTSVVQIPRNTRHAFVATSDVRAVQIYTPAGPEQRSEVHP